MSQDQLLTLAQVAERLQVSMSTVRRLVDRGALKTVRIGRNIRVRPEDLAKYIAAHLENGEGGRHD